MGDKWDDNLAAGAEMPAEPLSSMAEIGIELHNWLRNMVAGGLTEHQACMVMGYYLAGLAGNRSGDQP